MGPRLKGIIRKRLQNLTTAVTRIKNFLKDNLKPFSIIAKKTISCNIKAMIIVCSTLMGDVTNKTKIQVVNKKNIKTQSSKAQIFFPKPKF